MLEHDEVEPATSSPTPSCGTVFLADFLKVDANVLWGIGNKVRDQENNCLYLYDIPTFNCSVGNGPPPTRVV